MGKKRTPEMGEREVNKGQEIGWKRKGGGKGNN